MQIEVGLHKIFVEQDTIVTKVGGLFSLADAEAYTKIATELLDKYGRLYILTDLSGGFSMPPEARAYATEWSKTHKITGSAYVGASITTRAIVTLGMRAIEIMRQYSSPVVFTKTKAEALLWIAAHREKLLIGKTDNDK